MSHELTIRKSGKVEMAYAGQTPWHGLGEKLDYNSNIETWQTAAGMDWRILRSVVRYATSRDPSVPMRTMGDKHALFRSDDGAPLSIVSDGFQVVQPKAVLEFFRDLTDSFGYKLETAGTLFGGRRFWALASSGMSDTMTDARDRVNNYLLLSTSCDGSMATEVRETNICVVCHNTLSAARYGKAAYRLTHRSKFDPDAVKKELGLTDAAERFEATMKMFRSFAATPATANDLVAQTVELLSPDSLKLAIDDYKKVIESKQAGRILSLATSGAQIGGNFDGRANTQWAWLNAVTQFIDHEGTARTDNNRLASAWFGKGDQIKTRAVDIAQSAANGTPIVSKAKFEAVFG